MPVMLPVLVSNPAGKFPSCLTGTSLERAAKIHLKVKGFMAMHQIPRWLVNTIWKTQEVGVPLS